MNQALGGALESRLAITGESNPESLIDLQFTLRQRNVRGQRHQVQISRSMSRIGKKRARHHPALQLQSSHDHPIDNDRLKEVEEEVLAKAYDSRLMRRLLGYLRPYAWYIALSLVFLLVYSALQVCGPLLTKIAVDRYLAPTSRQFTTPIDAYLSTNRWKGLTQVSLIYLVVLVGSFASAFGQAYIMQYAGQRAMFDLRRELMTHLQRLDIAFFDRNPIGRLVTRVTTDVDVLNELFASGLVMILGDVLTLAFIVAVMWRLSPALTGLMLAVLPFVILTTALFRRAVTQSYRRVRIAIARINAYLQEHIVGIIVLQLFNRERKSREEFDGINNQHMDAWKEAIMAYGWFYPVVELLSTAAMASTIAYGGWRLENGAMTLGVIVAFLQYGMRFFRPIQDLSEKYNILQSAMASSERVFKLLDTPAEILSPAAPRAVPGSAAGIEFDHVWFAYKDEDWVLRDV